MTARSRRSEGARRRTEAYRSAWSLRLDPTMFRPTPRALAGLAIGLAFGTLALGGLACRERSESLGANDLGPRDGAFDARVDAQPRDAADGGPAVDAGDAGDAGLRDAGDAGGPPEELLRLSGADICLCALPGLCCPDFTVEIAPSFRCLCFVVCGDATACAPPPITWERQTPDGDWVGTAPSTNGAGVRCEVPVVQSRSLSGANTVEEFPLEEGTYRVRAILTEFAVGPTDGCLDEPTGTLEAVSNPIRIPFE